MPQLPNPLDTTEAAPGPDHAPKSEEEQWGTSQNPVRNDPLPAKGLKETGR